MTRAAVLPLVTMWCLSGPSALDAHDGPPYPIVSKHTMNGYVVSVWTDPDTTDDGSPGGQFWVILSPVDQGLPIAADVMARVAIQPLDRAGERRFGEAIPVEGDPSRRFVALTMDHEGRFKVRVDLERAAEIATVEAEVVATYDLRPSPWMLVLYAVPFALAGGLWIALLVKRRSLAARAR